LSAGVLAVVIAVLVASSGSGRKNPVGAHSTGISHTAGPTTAGSTATSVAPPTTTTIAPPPTTTTTTIAEPGLGASVQEIKGFFDSEGPSIQWSTGKATRYGPKTLGLTSKGNCDIEIDGPTGNAYDIELTCVVVGAGSNSAVQASNYLDDAVTTYAGTDATNWLDNEIQKVFNETTSTIPDIDAHYSAGSSDVEFQTTSALGSFGVYITAT
jgi:hypothetical protein